MSKKTESAPAKKPTDEAMATLMLDRQERMERCGKGLEEVLKRERCALNVANLALVDGKLIPQIQITPLD